MSLGSNTYANASDGRNPALIICSSFSYLCIIYALFAPLIGLCSTHLIENCIYSIQVLPTIVITLSLIEICIEIKKKKNYIFNILHTFIID